MTGDTLWWYRLSFKYSIPVPQLKKMLGSREFARCKVYYLEDANEFHPEYWYWAAIAAEIARANSKHPRKIKLKDRILNFVFKKRPSSGDEVKSVTSPLMEREEVRRKRAAEAAKAPWKMLFRRFRKKDE